MEDSGRKSGRMLLTLIMVFALIVLVFYFVKNYKLENVEIVQVGGEHYSEEELKSRLFTSKTDRYSYLFYLRFYWWGLEDIPFVEKADVELIDKNTCRIYVYYKAVAGCFEVMDEYMYFDREGYIVECASKPMEDIPIVRGLEFSDVVMYTKPDIGSDSYYDTIINLTLLLEKNRLKAQALSFSSRREVTLYIGDDTVRLGKRDAYDFQILNLGNILSGLPEGCYLVDMRDYGPDKMDVIARLNME